MRLLPLLVCVLLFVAVLANAEDAAAEKWLFAESKYAQLFKSFLTKYKKAFSALKLPNVLLTFKRNVDWILNKPKRGAATFGINAFAHLSESEFVALQGSRPPKSLAKKKGSLIEGGTPYSFAEVSDEAVASAFETGFDWKNKNVLLPAMNQLACGGCWAFAGAAAIQAAVAIAGGPKTGVSPQAFIDCAPRTDLCRGCRGGWSTCVFDYAKTTGFFTEAAVPFQNKETPCSVAGKTPAGKVAEVRTIGYQEATDAKFQAALQQGPLQIFIVVNKAVMFYKSGILDHESANCTSLEVNHSVLMTGYGSEAGVPFYNILNSWDTTYGENGYLRVKADGKGCAIYKWGSAQPIIAK